MVEYEYVVKRGVTGETNAYTNIVDLMIEVSELVAAMNYGILTGFSVVKVKLPIPVDTKFNPNPKRKSKVVSSES